MLRRERGEEEGFQVTEVLPLRTMATMTDAEKAAWVEFFQTVDEEPAVESELNDVIQVMKANNIGKPAKLGGLSAKDADAMKDYAKLPATGKSFLKRAIGVASASVKVLEA